MTKLEIYNECAKNPKEMFDFLRKDDFKMAKEFWGIEPDIKNHIFYSTQPSWGSHLWITFFSSDPLAYMRGFLSEVPVEGLLKKKHSTGKEEEK